MLTCVTVLSPAILTPAELVRPQDLWGDMRQRGGGVRWSRAREGSHTSTDDVTALSQLRNGNGEKQHAMRVKTHARGKFMSQQRQHLLHNHRLNLPPGCTCSSLMTSGGAKRMTFRCVGLASSPASLSARHISHAPRPSACSWTSPTQEGCTSVLYWGGSFGRDWGEGWH
jgi:hypothetical protein